MVLLLSIEAILRVHQPIQLLQEGNERQWLIETEEATSGMLPELEQAWVTDFNWFSKSILLLHSVIVNKGQLSRFVHSY